MTNTLKRASLDMIIEGEAIMVMRFIALNSIYYSNQYQSFYSINSNLSHLTGRWLHLKLFDGY